MQQKRAEACATNVLGRRIRKRAPLGGLGGPRASAGSRPHRRGGGKLATSFSDARSVNERVSVFERGSTFVLS